MCTSRSRMRRMTLVIFFFLPVLINQIYYTCGALHIRMHACGGRWSISGRERVGAQLIDKFLSCRIHLNV